MPNQVSSPYASVNAIKADFSAIYRQKDPRAYFNLLGSLDYVIPELAAPALVQLIDRLAQRKRKPVTVLDLGCSYGVLAASVRHGLAMDQLRDRYASSAIRRLSPERLAACDAHYFASWPKRADVRFIGLDASPAAVAYARRVGLIDDGLAVDLEAGALDAEARALVDGVDLIVSTGAVGYVTEKTFAELLSAFAPGRAPWVAAFVLRAFDYRAISETLAKRGLTTQRFEGATFVQRRFRDEAEYGEMLRLLDRAGVDPAGKEAEGLLHAELFVSRPQLEAKAVGVNEIISLSSGAPKFQDRFLAAAFADGELAA